ncbi:DNA helicase, putative [Plasmodium ovale wallikeri]|uniref:DNA helicase, putative n=2 Tax=Plasmodium ovale TaxID=36330 RepID=A0A1A8YTP1_PLAOA|nr:DNA helicase, putative [Plasmodium ovale wallikeri]SBT35456.1 DNA helicase, putative [Plasmodium ovale wallikeri]SBT77007.1 DNA helicase, putative [Plasmodium ovale]
MKRKSVFTKKNVIKAQNTLDKFGIFKKVNVAKKENENDQAKEEERDMGREKEREKEMIEMKKKEKAMQRAAEIAANIAAASEAVSPVPKKREGERTPAGDRKGGRDAIKVKKETYQGGSDDDNSNSNANADADANDNNNDNDNDNDNDIDLYDDNEKRNDDSVLKNDDNTENQKFAVKVKMEESVTKEKKRNTEMYRSKEEKNEKGKEENSNTIHQSREKKEKKKEDNTNESNLPLHKIYQPIYKEDYINEIRSKRNPLLTKVLDEDLNFNLILCGPPGSGKSSLVNVIKNKTNNLFISLFHLNNLNNELRKIYDQSIINYKLSKRKTILCIKDINRLNKNQQEHLLLILKKGYFYLLATCLFNPMNILNASLSSRCLYLYLNPYDKIELALIIKRIINKLDIDIEDNALNIIMNHSCGDARVAINIIDFAIQNMKREELNEKEKKCMLREKESLSWGKDSVHWEKETMPYENDLFDKIKKHDIMKKQLKLKGYNEFFHSTSTECSKKIIQLNNIKNFLQNFPCNDNKLDHYNFISGLHKSIRAGNVKAAILYLTKSLKNGEDPLYICRRLIRIASEDIGLANHDVLSICINTHYACKAIGMPECQTALIYAVIVLCKSSKSNYIYVVENNAKQICNEYSFDVPFHLRNTSNRYIYTNQPEILTFEEHLNKYKDVQKYLPDYIENLELLPEL